MFFKKLCVFVLLLMRLLNKSFYWVQAKLPSNPLPNHSCPQFNGRVDLRHVESFSFHLSSPLKVAQLQNSFLSYKMCYLLMKILCKCIFNDITIADHVLPCLRHVWMDIKLEGPLEGAGLGRGPTLYYPILR